MHVINYTFSSPNRDHKEGASLSIELLDASMDATHGFKGARRRTNGIRTVSGLSDSEHSESMLDMRSENS